MKTLLTIILLLISGDTYTELVPNITNPEQVIWEDITHVIFVKDENIFEYDILGKEMVKIGERFPNEFVGLGEDGNIRLLRFEHFVINTPEEYSTVFYIDEKELRFHPTIRPLYFKNDTIYAVTALDFLEQHYYEIHILDGSIKEIPKPAYIKSSLGIYEDIYGNIFVRLDLRKLIARYIRSFWFTFK